MCNTISEVLLKICNDPILLEVGRKAVEGHLVELRDDRISMLRNNGLVIKERGGAPSDIIRMGPEDAIRIALKAIAEYNLKQLAFLLVREGVI
jgi:hypothetical protein